MRFVEECIGRDVNGDDSVSVEGLMEMSCKSDKEKNSNVKEDGAHMTHIEERSILKLNRTDLTTKLNQGKEGQLLKVVKEEERHYEYDEQ